MTSQPATDVEVDLSLARQLYGPAKPRTGELRVQVHPGDDKGVGWARLRHPAAAARAAGVDVVEASHLPVIRAQRNSDKRMVIAPQHIDADVLVFQRPSNPEIVALIPALQARGIGVVIDIDDDVKAVARRNVTWGSENARLIGRACATADLVTTSTPALAAKYAPHGRVAVLENCVPACMLDLDRQSDGRTVGWSGWVGTHPDDLQVTHGGVAEAIRRTGWRFQMIGPPEGVKTALGLDQEPDSTGGLPVAMFQDALGLLDIGVCPLKDTAFNRSKSWLKPLEMTARGAVPVMSPLPEYERLHRQGIGVIAVDRSRSWRSRLVELMTSDRLRGELAERGMQVVRDHHTYEKNGWRWAEAWSSAARRSAS